MIVREITEAMVKNNCVKEKCCFYDVVNECAYDCCMYGASAEDEERKRGCLDMAKQWVEGRLGYNSQNDRYGLLVSDLWEYNGFHCGECLQVKIDGEWIDTSFEMDWSTGRGVWYLTGTEIRGEAIEHTSARLYQNY